ncbi:MAG: hypothetical protein ACXV7F_13140 [Methylomonas sp.]
MKIDTSKPGRSVLQPLTTTPATAYKTEVYDHQLDGADALIHQIIESNRQPGKLRMQMATSKDQALAF